tara:strand:- start:36 stop:275 length:240 start_codon:yes stop_codon:yes gene_type:complete
MEFQVGFNKSIEIIQLFETLLFCYDYYDRTNLPCKKIKINAINNYRNNNFGCYRIHLLSKKELNSLIANLLNLSLKNKK